ncbi:MAG: DinB family protein [bacterium]
MKNYFLDLFTYEQWANNAVTYALVKTEELPQKALSIMSHIIDAQQTWLSRINNIQTDVRVWEDYSVEEISGKLNKSSSDFIEYIDGITDDDLKKNINYSDTKGESFKSSLDEILNHLIIHSSYHRGQIILLIKPFVSVLPYTDYIHFARKIRAGSV